MQRSHHRTMLAIVTILGLSISALSAGGAFAVDAPDAGSEIKSDPTAPGRATDDVWPKPVDEFLAGNYLDRSDVVLTTRARDISSAVIRWATNSSFSHAALIFSGPQYDPGIDNTFVIEAGTGGVDLTNLRDYTSVKRSFVAIKRFKKDWFTEARRARVRGVLLDKIKATYGYWTIVNIARNIWFGVQKKVQGGEETLETYRKQEWTPPTEFICSGLVQVGFVEAVVEAIKRDELPPEALKEVVFHPEAASRLPNAGDWQYLGKEDSKATADLFKDINIGQLESVTPEDLAQSPKLEWQYVIRRGKVYKVSTYEEVKKLIGRRDR